MTRSQAYGLGRRFEEGVAAALEALELQSDHPNTLICLSVASWGLGRLDDAVAALRRVPPAVASQSYHLGHLGFMLGQAGQHDEARQILKTLHDRKRSQYVGFIWFAVIHCGLGEVEQALDHLERAYEKGSAAMQYLQWNQWRDLRDRPRFQALHTRVGLPKPPWEAVSPSNDQEAR